MSKRNGAQLELSKKGSMMHYNSDASCGSLNDSFVSNNGKTASYQQPMESGIDLHLYEPSILHVHDDGLLQFSAP